LVNDLARIIFDEIGKLLLYLPLRQTASLAAITRYGTFYNLFTDLSPPKCQIQQPTVTYNGACVYDSQKGDLFCRKVISQESLLADNRCEQDNDCRAYGNYLLALLILEIPANFVLLSFVVAPLKT
jgi:hypothetical protein